MKIGKIKIISVVMAVCILFASLPIAGIAAIAEDAKKAVLAIEKFNEQNEKPSAVVSEKNDTVKTVKSDVKYAGASAEQYLSYTVIAGKARIDRCSSAASGKLEVPEYVGGYQVQSIAENAFSGCVNLTGLVIPSSVVSMGSGAFKGCSGLIELTVPFVGQNAAAIENCTLGYLFGVSNYNISSNLKRVTVTGGARIGEDAFAGCGNITEINLPDTLKTIGRNAFGSYSSGSYRCSALKSIKIPEGVISIDASAFQDSGLTSIIIPDSVTTLGENAFYECYSLKTVKLSQGMSKINNSTFYRCSALTSIDIPENIMSIGERAFDRCSSLINLTIPSSVATVGDYAFYGCTGLISVMICEGVSAIGSYAFSGCKGILSLSLGDSVASIGDYAFNECLGISSLVMPAELAYLGSHAFYQCSSLLSLELSAKTENIGSYAFFGCDSLTSVSIPNGVKAIGASAFSSCSLLKSIAIPQSVEIIDNCAFGYCPQLKEISVSSNNSNYYAVNRCLVDRQNKSVILGCYASVIPADGSITRIDDYAFAGQYGITSLKIPSSVEIIGEGAFAGCSGIVSLTVPSSVKTMGSGAFKGCSGLIELTVPFVGQNAAAIENCTLGYLFDTSNYNISSNLKRVTVTGGARIGDNAFAGCGNITEINLPDTLKTIGYNAFGSYSSGNYRCSALKSIKIPEGVILIDASAFQYNGLTSIIIPDSVTTLGEKAFYECSYLKTVKLSQGMSKINNSTFYRCSALTSIDIPENIMSIGERAFDRCSSLINLTIPSSVATVGDYAFYGCTGLISVTVCEGVSAIGSYAFSGCSGLIKAKIAESVAAIGGSAFASCPALTICGFNGSAAQEYAFDNGIPFELMKPYCDHTFGDWHNGVRICTKCFDEEVCFHKYGAWIPVKEATADEDGLKKRICEVCGMEEQVVIAYVPSIDEAKAAIALNDTTTVIGNMAYVNLDITKNPGISYLRVTVKTAEGVTLCDAVNGEIISDLDRDINLVWSADENSKSTGNLATLVFEVAPNTPVGESDVEIIVRECYNAKGESISVNVTNAKINIYDFYFGDANGDGEVNGKDVLLMRQYFASLDDDTGLSSVSVYTGADANGDGSIDGRDLILLRQYMANYNDETGKSSVILGK